MMECYPIWSNLCNLYPLSSKQLVAHKNCSANLSKSQHRKISKVPTWSYVPVPVFSLLLFHSVTRCACVSARKTYLKI
jgi:hypothetical protein